MTFALSSGLAGVAGCALTLLGPIGPSLGTYYIVDAFMVVVLGGVGQLIGAVMAAFSIGGLNTFLEYGTSASLAKVLVFVDRHRLPAVAAVRTWCARRSAIDTSEGARMARGSRLFDSEWPSCGQLLLVAVVGVLLLFVAADVCLRVPAEPAGQAA